MKLVHLLVTAGVAALSASQAARAEDGQVGGWTVSEADSTPEQATESADEPHAQNFKLISWADVIAALQLGD